MSATGGPRLSIRAQLAALALAAVAPLAALLGWNLYAQAEREDEHARADVLQLAEATAAQTAAFLGQAHNILNGLAARPALRALDPARCDPILDDFLKLAPRFANALTLTLDAELVCSAVPPAGPARADPELLARVVRGPRELTVGRARQGPVTGKWIVPLTRPLLDAGGSVAGAVVLTLDLATFPLLQGREALPHDALIGLVAADGTILARTRDAARFVGTKVDTRRPAFAGGRGTAQVDGLDGIPRIQGFAPVPGSDWIAVASLPAAQVHAPARARALRGALVAVAVLVVVLFLAAFWARRLREPIDALAAVSAEVAGGNLASRAPVGGSREIAQVAGQFNRMLDALERDLAERVRSQAMLAGSEERYRGLVENLTDLVCTHDLEGTVLFANRAAVDQLGYTPAQLAGRNLREIVEPAQRAEVDAYLERIRREGRASGLMRVRTAAGESRTLEYRNVLREGRPGEAPTVLGVAQDVTERRRAEDALREAEARQRQVLDNMFPFVGLLSPDGVVLEANRAPLEAAGLAREDVIGKPCAEAWWFSYSAEVQERLRAALARAAAGEPARYDETIRVAGGRFMVIDLMFSPLRDAGGRVERIVGSATDVTERAAAELRRQAYAKQMERLSRRLIEVEETERRAFSRELHDRIGQNLATLSLNLKLVRRSVAAGAPPPVLARLDDAHALLDATTREARNLMADLHPPALEDYGLNAALRAYADTLAARSGMRVEVVGGDLTPRLAPAVELALFRIAQEALANAAKHAQADRATVTLSTADGRVTLAVADEGRGFDPGRLAGSATWGLAIMRERAVAAGAQLHIDAAPGRGARVVVEVARAAKEGARYLSREGVE